MADKVKDKNQIKESILHAKTALGIELGSTRIKAVLIDEKHQPIAQGSFTWENKLENGIWTYSLDDAWKGLQASYSELANNVANEYGVTLTKVGSIGISGMMHGYLVFDKNDKQLVPFRTWRNTITEESAAQLTELLQFNIPQRWSIAHLYQAILNQEEHVSDISYMTTLSGYIHWKLTGEKVLGVGDASGMFPIDSSSNNFNQDMLDKFSNKIQGAGYPWKIKDILPKILIAGEPAGILTKEGAKLLDPSGNLEASIPLCAPEGDAGTGMVATNSVEEHTGNISAGTSVFAMIVLEKELSDVYLEIDMVTTPDGKPVAMVHCNNFTSDIDAWVNLFHELTEKLNLGISKSTLYNTLYMEALKGESDGGGLLSFNYYAGEPITRLDEGRPLLARLPDSRFNLANLMRTHVFSALATLRIGMDILTEKENVRVDNILGHGGFFKTEKAGQVLMSASLNMPVTVMETAGEGGAWGIALLAAYMAWKKEEESLPSYFNEKVFGSNKGITVQPDTKDLEGFDRFMVRYKEGLQIQKAAVDHLR